MKVVKSTNDLKRMALSKGASVTIGKDKFNSVMAKADKKPEPTVAPEPIKPQPVVECKPETVAQDALQNMQASIDAIGSCAKKADDLSQSNAKVIAEVQKVLAAVSAKPADRPVASWVMTVERDTRGLLTQIIATPRL